MRPNIYRRELKRPEINRSRRQMAAATKKHSQEKMRQRRKMSGTFRSDDRAVTQFYALMCFLIFNVLSTSVAHSRVGHTKSLILTWYLVTILDCSSWLRLIALEPNNFSSAGSHFFPAVLFTWRNNIWKELGLNQGHLALRATPDHGSSNIKGWLKGWGVVTTEWSAHRETI